jgi:type IX secretion system PorP/SprF family membrane protein
LKYLAIIILISIGSAIHSQDPQFSQFYANSLHLNPALAGKDLSPRFHSGYRNQWPGHNNAYVTYNLEYDDLIEKIHGGLGIQLLHDKTANGLLNSTLLSLCYAYQLKLSKGWSASFSLKGAFQQKSFDRSLAQYGDQIDEVRGFIYSTNQIINNPTSSYFDAGAGAVLFSPKSYVGFAMHHLTRPVESFIVNGSQNNKIPIRYTIHAGKQIKVLKNGLFHKALFISPNFLFDLQSNFKQFNFGSYFVDGVLGFGVWYRHTNFLNPNSEQFRFQDALILMGGIENKKLRIGYSYDISLSNLGINSGGAHEISITFDLPQKEGKSDKYRVIYCPVF